MSDCVTDHPRITIAKIICLLSKHYSVENKNPYFLCGSVNKDGNTYLPLDLISEYECICSHPHEFKILSKVDYTFYAVNFDN